MPGAASKAAFDTKPARTLPATSSVAGGEVFGVTDDEAGGLLRTSTRPTLNLLLLLLLLLLRVSVLSGRLLRTSARSTLHLLLLLLVLCGVIENKHSTDVESTSRVRASV